MVKWLDCGTCNHKAVGSNPAKLTADFTMTRISIVDQLLNQNVLICAIHTNRCYSNVCMRVIGCCQLGVYIPPCWSFDEFPCWEGYRNKQMTEKQDGCTMTHLFHCEENIT